MLSASESTFIPVDVNTIKPDMVKTFEVFHRTSEGRMMPYCADARVKDERIYEQILDKKIVNLYIYRKDKSLYDRYIESILLDILSDENIGSHQKAKIAYSSLASAEKNLFEGPKAESIARLKKTIADVVDYVFMKEDAIQDIIGMTSFDYTPYNHSLNVGIFGTGLIRELMKKKPDDAVKEVAAGFFLHDIGKTTIPIDILNKKSSLSPIEWKLIKKHPEEGCKILDRNKMLTKESEIIILQHHERYNGTGYPSGHRKDQIHLYGSICAIADVFEGLTSFRPYKKEHSSFDALQIMRKEMPKDFDPVLFTKFIHLFKK